MVGKSRKNVTLSYRERVAQRKARNKERVLAIYFTRGHDMTLKEIAEEAGVGMHSVSKYITEHFEERDEQRAGGQDGWRAE